MMEEPVFSRELGKALDAYCVPPVPQGFSDRLMARIASFDSSLNVASAVPPVLRPRRASPWRRTGRLVGIVATFSVATATAAAAGIFGKQVYVPGVSEVLVEAKIVEVPKTVIPPRVRTVVEAKSVAPARPTQSQENGSAAIVRRVTELRQDTEYSTLTARQRMTVAANEVRKMVRSGEANKQDVRPAVRELARNADPETKEAWRKAATERRQRRLQRQEILRNTTPEERAAFREALQERRRALQTDPAVQ